MNKYSTGQLKAALIELHKRNDEAANRAYRMTFDELNARMGDDAFDAWLEEVGI